MSVPSEKTAKGPVPPYIAFKTMTDVIERMEREGPPTRVDPTYLDSYAGGYRPTVIGNFQTLGLLEKSGEPTDRLKLLVQSTEAQRKEIISEFVQEMYAEVFALGLNSTQGQFLEWFASRGVQGDTRRKAISFFLKACQFAGIERGTHWKTPPAGSSGTRRKSPAAKVVVTDDGGDNQTPTDEEVAVVRLRSGRTLTLAIDGGILTMPKDDRDFVFEIVDKMLGYEQPPVDFDGDQDDEDEGGGS